MNDLMDTLKLDPASLRHKSPSIKTRESDFLFVNATHQAAYKLLVEGIRQHRGLLILTGETGVGKTLLLRKLVSEPPANLQFVFCYAAADLDFEGLLRTVTEQLGIANTKQSGPPLTAIKRYLGNRFSQDVDVALLIDEANRLSPQVLESLLDLFRVQLKAGRALQIVLSGTAGLEEMLVKMRTFQPYLASASYIRLEPFAAADLKTFIARQIKEADGPLVDSLFPATLFERIQHHTGGASHSVDRLCEHALFLAHLNGQQTVTAALIDEAASELMLQPKKTAPPSGKDIVSAEITRSGTATQIAEMERFLIQGENLFNDDTQSMLVKPGSLRELERHLEEGRPRRQPKARVTDAQGSKLNAVRFLSLLLAALLAGLIGGLGSSYWYRPQPAPVEPAPVARPAETPVATVATAPAAPVAAETPAVPPVATAPATPAAPVASETSAVPPAAPSPAPSAVSAATLETRAPAPVVSASPPSTAKVDVSPAPSPPVASSPTSIAPEAARISSYLASGHALMERKDVAAARLFYEAAANLGSGDAMVAVGTTYDPTVLERLAVKGFRADPVKAAEWYLKVRDHPESSQHLAGLKAWLSASAPLKDSEADTLRQLLR